MFTVNQVVCSAATCRKGTLLVVKSLVTSPQSDLKAVKTHVRLNQGIQVPAICWQVLSENVDLMSAGTTWTANYSPSVQHCVRIRLQEEACENILENVRIPFFWTLAMPFH